MIRVSNATKYYGEHLAVDEISFAVERNEIVGLLGPNAAGKTTTLRMVTGYLVPTSGDVWVADHNTITDPLEARRAIGYLPELAPLYTDMTVRQFLSYVGQLRGLDRRESESRAAEVAGMCALDEYADVIVGKLSKGYRQRVGLAQAIVHDPEVLVLDEPTVGIDPIQVAETRSLIRDLGRGRAILLSTHILPEVSLICDRVVVIHQGRVVAQERIQDLSAALQGRSCLRLTVTGPAQAVTDRLLTIPGVNNVTYEAPAHTVEYANGSEPQSEIARIVVEEGWTLRSLESVTMSLEETFLKLTTEAEGTR